MNEFDGVLLIDKDSGCSSHDVVNKVRRCLKIRSVGHAGTLDPLATGLLVILVGKATKLSQYLMSLDKVYTGKFVLGIETNSQDSEGEVVAELPVPEGLTEESLRRQMASFIGDQYQTPPMFSAKKVNGIPLYKLARQGQEVERKPRFINIARFDLHEFNKPEVSFELACTKGTYVRTVCHDLGKRIGCGAHMTALRRISSGKFDISKAITVEQLQQMNPSAIKKVLIPVAEAAPSFAL